MASYRDFLTDLGISDRVVEEIQLLNEEYLDRSLGYSQGNPNDENREYSDELREYEIEYYLRTEGFIK